MKDEEIETCQVCYGRRETIAVGILSGLVSNPNFNPDNDMSSVLGKADSASAVIDRSIWMADRLIKALENREEEYCVRGKMEYF